MENCKPVSVPLLKGTKLNEKQCSKTHEEKERMNGITYASTLGSFMYDMLFILPDLNYAIGLLTRYQKKPDEEHWNHIKRVLRYVKNNY